MLEKNQMLDQLYNTLKELKQQYEAAREVRPHFMQCYVLSSFCVKSFLTSLSLSLP